MPKGTSTPTPEDRLKAIAAYRPQVLKLRLRLTAAKEHVKQLNAQVLVELEQLLKEIDHPSLPVPDEP